MQHKVMVSIICNGDAFCDLKINHSFLKLKFKNGGILISVLIYWETGESPVEDYQDVQEQRTC